MHIHTSQWTRTRHIFRFSRSGKREVDVNHNSDYSVILCHDPLSELAIVVSLRMKLMHTRRDSPRFDSALRNKGHVRSCNAQMDESLVWNMSLSTECAAALLSFRYASSYYARPRGPMGIPGSNTGGVECFFFSGKITCSQINKVIHSKSKVFIFRPYFLYTCYKH